MSKTNEKPDTGLLASKVVEQLRKAFGESILRKATTQPDYVRVRTGIFDLDLGLGGGFALGRVHNIYGPKSSGKTTIYLRTIAELQRRCHKCFSYEKDHKKTCGKFMPHVCVWMDIEGTFDSLWAAKQGVDLDSLVLTSPDFGEQAIDIVDSLLRSGEVHAIVLDSLAMLSPTKEIEESTSKTLMGNQPKMIGTGMRKIVSALNAAENEGRARPTVFLTNQIRFKLGLLFGNPETQPGGTAPGFVASTETRVQQAGTESDDETNFSTKTKVKFKVEKNKTFGPKISGEYAMAHNEPGYQEGDFIYEDSLVDWAERTGYTQGTGHKKTINGRTFNKKQEIIDALKNRQDPWTQKVYDDVLTLALSYYGRGTEKSDTEVAEPEQDQDQQG